MMIENSGKVRVAAVSYLNTKPLLYGLANNPIKDDIILSVDYPARIGAQLISGEVDVALIPVAMLPEMKEYHIISDYCIGAEGPVASVCLFSDVPIGEITSLYLDFESRSSVALARYLLREYWQVAPTFLNAAPGYESLITGTVGGVVIGDRALRQRKVNRYVYDLAEAWIGHTGLPMVFAAWVSNKVLQADFITRFNTATGAGTRGSELEAVIARTPCDFYDLHDYYTKHISYELTPKKRAGLKKFLDMLQEPSGI